MYVSEEYFENEIWSDFKRLVSEFNKDKNDNTVIDHLCETISLIYKHLFFEEKFNPYFIKYYQIIYSSENNVLNNLIISTSKDEMRNILRGFFK